MSTRSKFLSALLAFAVAFGAAAAQADGIENPFSLGSKGSGYQQLGSGGEYVEWGYVAAASGNQVTITYPHTFSTSADNVTVTTAGGDCGGAWASNVETNQFYAAWTNSGACDIYWIAFGH